MPAVATLVFSLLLVSAGFGMGLRTWAGSPRLLESFGDQGFDELLGSDAGRGLELALASVLVIAGLLVALGILPPDA